MLELAKVHTAEELEKLGNQITDKKEDLSIHQRLLDEVESKSGNADFFNMIVDLRYENQTLREKVQQLQTKLQQAYDFMKQIVISGRNLFEMFCEQIGELKERFKDNVITRKGRSV